MKDSSQYVAAAGSVTSNEIELVPRCVKLLRRPGRDRRGEEGRHNRSLGEKPEGVDEVGNPLWGPKRPSEPRPDNLILVDRVQKREF